MASTFDQLKKGNLKYNSMVKDKYKEYNFFAKDPSGIFGISR